VNRATAARFGAAAVTGALLAAARPPFDLGPLACVAFVPLFVAWRGRRVRTTAALAFVAAAVYYSILMSWSWYFGTIAIVPLVIALGAYWAAAGAVLGWLRNQGVANPFLVAAVWVLAEATVARVPLGGFSWGEVGYAFREHGRSFVRLGRYLRTVVPAVHRELNAPAVPPSGHGHAGALAADGAHGEHGALRGPLAQAERPAGDAGDAGRGHRDAVHQHVGLAAGEPGAADDDVRLRGAVALE